MHVYHFNVLVHFKRFKATLSGVHAPSINSACFIHIKRLFFTFQVYASEVRARGVGGMAKDTEALAFKFGTSFSAKSKGKPPRALATKTKKASPKKTPKTTAMKGKGAAKKGKKATEKGKKKGIPKTSVKKIKGKTKKRKLKKKTPKRKVYTFGLFK